MLRHLRKGRLALAFAMLAVLCLGFATPALAEGEATYAPSDAKLTKVIDAPEDTDASGDYYVFHFAGGGTVTETGDDLYSDEVRQDSSTLKVGDVVPTIADQRLDGVAFTSANTLSNGQEAQAVVQKPLSEILPPVADFPHAGVYTYVVTESTVVRGETTTNAKININASMAQYVLHVRVSNTKTATDSELKNRELTIESVTVEQVKDDNGSDLDPATKIDPTYPTTTNVNKIDHVSETESPASGTIAGDARGRDVPGFTFANEYIKGGSFEVRKLYDGTHSDRTKYSHVKLAVYSAAAKNPDSWGCCLTYRIEGNGVDRTKNTNSYGAHIKLDGIERNISQVNDYMVEFDHDGWAYIEADLKEDSYINITGEFGPFNTEYATDPKNPYQPDKRMELSLTGLLTGQDYYVIESMPGDYEPTGYVYVGEGTDVDPRVDATGMTTTQKLSTDTTDPTVVTGEAPTIPEGGLLVHDSATGSATTVFVVNKIDEDNVIPTGILINNLPYILMVAVPVGAFAAMFVLKRRRNAAA